MCARVVSCATAGYAEIVPIAGRYALTDQDDLSLETPYEGGAVEETFAFDSPDVCNRTSTVRRFGGVATATFSTEVRLGVPGAAESVDDVDETQRQLEDVFRNRLFFGSGTSGEKEKPKLTTDFLPGSRARFREVAKRAIEGNGKPSANSAFGEGFSAPRKSMPAEVGADDVVQAAARKAGIDLSKVPPSMRDEFLASLKKDSTVSKE